MQQINDDEIDLGEIFSALLNGWKIILIFTSFFLVGSLYYAMNGPLEKFESVAKIQLSEENSRPQFSEFGGIASLAGITLPSNSSDQLKLETRLTSRKFILGLDEKVNLFADKYLNPYQNKSVDDNFSFADLKLFVREFYRDKNGSNDAEKHQFDLKSKIEYEVVKNFRLNLRIEERDNGLLQVFFKHTSPIRSAAILNWALEEAINQIDYEKKEGARLSLNYLEGELMRIQEDLEAAIDAIQAYAIEYNIGSIKDLASSSLRADILRDELKVLRDTRLAIDFFSSLEIFTNRSISDARATYPFIGTLDFRSRLNLPADMNVWTKPSDDVFEAAQLRVSLQIEDLTALISGLEQKARNTANEAKMYGELQRNIKVQETLYEVLIKQFESQSLSAGLPGKSVEFFDPGVPPLEKIEPKRSLIVSLGLVFGLFLGSTFVLVRAALTRIIYSKRAMLGTVKKLGTLIRLSGVNSTCGRNFVNSFATVRSNFHKYQSLVSFIDPKQIICGVVSTHNEANTRLLGLVLMQAMLKFSEKVQLIDVKNLFKLDNCNETDINFLGQINSLTVERDCEVIQPHSALNSYELKLYIDKVRQDGTAVLVLFGNLENEHNELMMLSHSFDSMFFGVQVKRTTKNHLEVIDEVLSGCEKPGAMVYC